MNCIVLSICQTNNVQFIQFIMIEGWQEQESIGLNFTVKAEGSVTLSRNYFPLKFGFFYTQRQCDGPPEALAI